jgi:hypothetical protein
MSDTQQKFLDQKGVEYLWSKISMQDYPNNETLISVISAIDETKADKINWYRINYGTDLYPTYGYFTNSEHSPNPIDVERGLTLQID